MPEIYGGKSKKDASAYHFLAFAKAARPRELSSVTFSVPLSWAASRAQGAYLELVLRAAELLRPEHGYAGLSVILPPREPGQGSDMAYAVPIALRFRGVDLDIAFMQARFMHAGIKGVNWLTILGDAWIEKLGGVATVKTALRADIPVHTYEGGIIVQAGPNPVFGDVNRNEPMPYYERVAQVVKPIRLVDFRAVAPHHGMDRERTREWLARFER